eukprot:5037616-Prymnesium_polylepis.1
MCPTKPEGDFAKSPRISPPHCPVPTLIVVYVSPTRDGDAADPRSAGATVWRIAEALHTV